MKAFSIVRLLFFICNLCIGTLALGNRTTTDRIESAGFGSETHEIITNDGYILTIFRIKNSNSADNTQRPVVLLMHGFVSSSDVWVISTPEDSLAFTLASRGYDVWLTNARGNTYSSRHLSLALNDPKFWRFSWHKIGVIDLPAAINYILKETGEASLHYVGHSQGTTVMLALLSTLPAYNEKMTTVHLLAPIAYIQHARSQLLQLSPLVGSYGPFGNLVADAALFQLPFVRNIVGFDRCQRSLFDESYCLFLLFATVYGGISGYFNRTLAPEVFNTHPASASTHQGIHYAQLRVSGRFCQYDLGFANNLKRYNRPTPPDYRLSNINPKFPLHLYYSNYDDLASTTDVEKLSRVLGNKAVTHFVDYEEFSHLDFILASNVKDVVIRPIVKIMDEAELKLRGRVQNNPPLGRRRYYSTYDDNEFSEVEIF